MKYIAIDWGSSSFRAYLINQAGEIAGCVENTKGVFAHTDGDFESTLIEACGEWLKQWPQLPIVMAGMIGSRNGWIETPYVPCPVDNDRLSHHLCTLTSSLDTKLQVVPGICGNSPSGSPDVMRGEEVQIFGALEVAGLTDAMVCLPGTHSKWARVESGAVTRFSTFFTGEVFGLLKNHSSIGAILEEEPIDEDSFIGGIQYSRSSGGLLHHIFSARAKQLTQQWHGKSLSSYLSGIVIGHEFDEALNLYPTTTHILVVCNDTLQHLYRLAAESFGLNATHVDASQTIIQGLSRIIETSRVSEQEHLC